MFLWRCQKKFEHRKVFFRPRWMTEVLEWKKDSYALESLESGKRPPFLQAELLSLCEKLEHLSCFGLARGLLRGVSPCLAIMSCSVMVNSRVGWPWETKKLLGTAFATIIDEPWLSSKLLPSVSGRQSSQQGYEIVRSHQQCLRFCPVPHERSGGPCHSPSVGACLHGLRVLHGRRISQWQRTPSGSVSSKAGEGKCQGIFWQKVVENIHFRAMIDLCAGLPTAMQARTTFPGDEAGPQSFSPNFTCQMHQDSAMPTHQCCSRKCSAHFLFQHLCFSTISV